MRKRIAFVLVAAACAVTALGGMANAGTSTGHANRVVKLHQNATAAAKPNVAHSYTTAMTGGTGQVLYTIPSLPNGNYLVSYTANFFPVAGENFSCYVFGSASGLMYTQDTTYSPVSSGFYEGVNGLAVIHNPSSGTVAIQAGCGTPDGSAWSFGTRQLVVTLTRLDGLTNGSLSPAPKPKRGANPAIAG
jgi:hypothetical protein